MADRTPDGELPNLGLLIKLMKMTTSNVDHEALLAIRKANEQLVKFGGDWEALLSGKVTVIGDPFERVPTPPPTPKEDVDFRRAPNTPFRRPPPTATPTPPRTGWNTPPRPTAQAAQAAPPRPAAKATVTKRRFKKGSVTLEDLV